ncbi:CHRD domain-containing protein [Natronorarus salvus]|uniref:CHRD domain-containing protein n=1 Tax=Natronorarus salvus TaxID=3117733 RepID=UPI002F265E3E
MSDNHVNRRTVLGAVGTTVVGGMLATGSAAAEGHAETFSAELTGAAEVPPVETNASGRATFEVAEDGSAVHFQVYIDCIQNVTQGHIHLGAEGENGPVVVWLYPQDTREPTLLEGVRRDFVLAEGTLTEEDLVGDFEGESLGSLAEAMREEDVYVNIHSEQNPAGEIRGQIVPDEEAEVTEVEEPEELPEEEDPDEEEEPEEEPDEGPISTADEAQGSIAVTERNVNVGQFNPDEEYITFQNTGDRPIDMTGWYLRDRFDSGVVDSRGDPRFQFPRFVLEPGAEVSVYSGVGNDDDENLYWGLTGQNVWLVQGDVIILKDANLDIVLEDEYGNPPNSIRFVFSVLRSLFA